MIDNGSGSRDTYDRPRTTRLGSRWFDEVARVAALVDQKNVERVTLASFYDDWWQVVGRPRKEERLAPEAADPLLREMYGRWARVMSSRARQFGVLRWLWYSRHLPDHLYRGQLWVTRVRTRQLFEVSAALGGRGVDESESVDASGDFSFPIDIESITQAVIFLEHAAVLNLLRAALTSCSYGSSIVVGSESFPVRSAEDPEFEAALQLHDQRSGIQFGSFLGLATVPVEDLGTRDNLQIGQLHRLSPPADFSFVDSFTAHAEVIHARYRYDSVGVFNALRLLDDPSLRDNQPWTHFVGALFVVLHLVYRVFLRARGRERYPPLLTGYVLFRAGSLETILAEFLPGLNGVFAERGLTIQLPQSVNEFFSALERPPSVLPIKSSPILLRTSRGGVLLDAANAWPRMYEELEFPPMTGKVGNLRAGHFEDNVQLVIDRSDWNPSTGFRNVRQKTLRLDGRPLTDIDALGFRDGKLLIVSCKSIRQPQELEPLAWKASRNNKDIVEKAVVKLESVLIELRTRLADITPSIPAFSEVFGVVCTPQLEFVSIGPLTEEVLPGLRLAVSLAELYAWLTPVSRPERPLDPFAGTETPTR